MISLEHNAQEINRLIVIGVISFLVHELTHPVR